MIRSKALACMLLISGPSAMGVTPELTWQFGSAAYDSSGGISLDGLGGVYITGNTSGNLGQNHAGDGDVFLTKYDVFGNYHWTRQLGTSESEGAAGVAADGLGNVFIGGTTLGSLGGPLQGSVNAYVGNFDADGNQRWIRQVGDDITDGRAVSADGTGNAYLVGWTRADLGGLPHSGGFEAFVAKYDAAGNRPWYRQIGSSEDVYGLAVSAERLGSIYVSGYTFGNLSGANAGGRDAFLVKYDASGSRLWTRQLGTSESDRGEAVAADALGNVFLAGTTEGSLGGPNFGGPDVFVSKYDASGSLQWKRQFGTTSLEENVSAATDGLGNLYVAGATRGDFNGGNQAGIKAFLSKLDSSGNLLWTQMLGTPSNGRGVAHALGDVFAAGTTGASLGGPNAGSADVFVMKFNDRIPEPNTKLLLFAAVIALSPASRRLRK